MVERNQANWVSEKDHLANEGYLWIAGVGEQGPTRIKRDGVVMTKKLVSLFHNDKCEHFFSNIDRGGEIKRKNHVVDLT